MENVWHTLEGTQAAIWVKTSTWAYPLLETAHVIGLGLLFGSIFVLDLRLMGVGRPLPLNLLARHMLPWVWTGFIVNAVSGALLFMSDAAEFAANTAFRVKIVLILLAGLNAAYFHARAYRYAVEVDPARHDIPRASLLAALVSIALWVSVITAGRMIAYVE
ncbi:MAG: hypothetical protein MPJ78_11645 [Hyphomicrobiaceae bacterium]|nr:hypothetical protein [Hyphomicrobiaceae bacterium]